jgi:hypothetical protein
LLPQQHHPEMPRTKPKGLAVHLETFRRKFHHSFFKVYMVKFMGLIFWLEFPPTWGCRAGLIDGYIHVNPISSDIPSITMVKHLQVYLEPQR